MSVDVSGFDTNITYLNLHQIGLADREDTPCIAKINYPSPLLGRVDGYLATVNRFVIPTHTLYMNDHIKSAIILYTNDWVRLYESQQEGQGPEVRQIVAMDVDHLRTEQHYLMTPEQTAYFNTEHNAHVQATAPEGPTLYHGSNHDNTWREIIHTDMANDNVGFFNGLDDEESTYTFDYTQCHTLYEFSELLETWCKRVTYKIRDQGEYVWVPQHQGNPAHLEIVQGTEVAHSPKLYDRNGVQMSLEQYQSFLLRIFIAPDYTLRVLCSAPKFIGCYFHKAFRNIFKLPRFLDNDMQMLAGASPNDFTHAVMPMNFNPLYYPDDTEAQREQRVADYSVPFLPRLSFQVTYHRVQGFTLTSDLHSISELSIQNAWYRILSDFKYTPSSGTIESSASKNNFLSTDTNFISEAPPGNVEYFAANGTTGRLVLLRGAYPLYGMLVSVMTDVLVQNPYERREDGYIKFQPGIKGVIPAREQLMLAPNARFTCKIAFVSRQKMKHIHPPGSH